MMNAVRNDDAISIEGCLDVVNVCNSYENSMYSELGKKKENE